MLKYIKNLFSRCKRVQVKDLFTLNATGTVTKYNISLDTELVSIDHYKDVDVTRYTGALYGITLPVGHIVFVRRNGKTVWSGNSNMAASKGVIGKVIPDDKMPRNPVTNQPYDVIFNPMSIPSRVAPKQQAEAALGKIAKAKGFVYKLPQVPPPEGWAQFAKNELKKHGMSETEDIYDPELGKTIKGVATGNMYIAAFHHLAEKKLTTRSTGAYDSNEQPVKGGDEFAQAQAFGGFDTMAVLAHNAPEVLKDAMLIRGAKNEEFWQSLKYGRAIPEPKRPFIYDKFFNLLRSAGINVEQKGSIAKIMPMTDKDVEKLAGNNEIQNGRHIDNKLNPVPGGLFDKSITGGADGTKWSYVKLHEPIPNPIMETPIQKILGLTNKEYRDILSGKQPLEGSVGGAAIKKALSKIDIDKEIEKNKKVIATTRGATRDRAVKVLSYLSSAKKMGVHPSDWVISEVPVLPPVFRPITNVGNISMVNDMNTLYTDLIETNNNLKELSKDLPPEALAEERSKLYDALTAVTGLGQPINPEGVAKGLKGAVKIIAGSVPKFGLFQSKVIAKTQDSVGRGVITPDPSLDMDSVGIPEDSAWKLYKPFVMRRLVRRGYTPVVALKAIEDRDTVAREMLEAEMDYRPVFLDRAPTWHKFNFLAFKAHPVKGKVLRVSPIIVAGFNADFDGDTMAFHVPASDKAVKEAKNKMLPSKNLFKTNTMRDLMHTTGKEFALGIYEATSRVSNKKPIVFNSVEAAKRAFKEGKIDITDPIIIQ